MVNLPILGAGLAVPVIVIVIYLVAIRTRHHYNSTLTCPNYHHTFEFKWVPL